MHLIKGAIFTTSVWEGIKTLNRTEQNGTERNGTGSNCCTIRTRTLIRYRKLVLICQAYQWTENWSRVLYLPRRRDKPPADSIEPHQAYEAIYLESSSDVADPSLTSEGSVMSLPSLALDSAVGSGVNSSVAHPGTARQWYHALYSPPIWNKHHQRVSDQACQQTRKLTWPMAEPIAGYVLPQQLYTLDVALCWCLSRLCSCYRTQDQSPCM